MTIAWLRYVAYAGWLAIAVLSLVPGHDRPHTGFSGISEHFAAYALVAAAFFLSARNTRQGLIFAAAIIAASAVFEVCQLYIPGRRSEVVGVLSAAAGVGFAAAVVSMIKLVANRRS